MISKTTAHVILHVAYSVEQPTHSRHQSLINYTPSHPALIHPQTRTSLTQPPAHPHTISLITITHSFTHTSPIQSHDVTLSHTSLTQPPAHPHIISLITITHSFTRTSPVHSHDITLSHTHHIHTPTEHSLTYKPTHLPTHPPTCAFIIHQ